MEQIDNVRPATMPMQFTSPEYHTPASRKPALKYRVLPCRSALFLWGVYMGHTLSGLKKALRGDFSEQDMVEGCHGVAEEVEKAGGKIHVTGLDNVDRSNGPVVFVANHMSTLETMVLPGIITPRLPTSFVVKKSLVEGRFFGPIMRALQPVPVGRKNPRSDLKVVLNEGTERLQRGRGVFLFPQSTRRPDFDPAAFNSLGVKLARRAGVPIAPVAVKTDFWTPGRLIRDFGRIHPDRDVCFAFGRPVAVEGTGRKAHEEVIAFIQSKIREWNRGLAAAG